MKTTRGRKSIQVPPPRASYEQLAEFFDRHDTVELLEQGVMVEDPDTSHLKQLADARKKEPNTERLQLRVPASAKSRIESLARRKAVDVPTLVRIWVMDAIRREGTNRR